MNAFSARPFPGSIPQGTRCLPVSASRTRARFNLAIVASIVLLGFATTRIVLTYRAFSATADEPATVAAGMEWLDQGTYRVDNSHPPLARVAAALGPYLAGLRMPAGEFKDLTEPRRAADWPEVGKRIFYERDSYSRNLALARLGVLPFFVLATALVAIWTRKVFGDMACLLAVLLFTTLPPVLGNAGLATTDIVMTATLMATLLALMYQLERPTYFGSCVLGLTTALAILSRFSVLAFLPACGLAMVACRWMVTRNKGRSMQPWKRRAARAGVCGIVIFLVVWAGYRFSVRPPHPLEESSSQILGTKGALHDLASAMAENVPVPAPELFSGIRFQRQHNYFGSASYLFGKARRGGWWYFFPVVLAVKTPLAFLILSGIGVVSILRKGLVRNDWRALALPAMAAAVLVVSMFSKINLGVRLILPVYPLLAIVAGYGAFRLWTFAYARPIGPAILALLLLWQITASARIHPDYLAYFNELAGSHPEHIVVGPDLDWGQDLSRLVETLRARKIDVVSAACVGLPEFKAPDSLQLRPLLPFQPTTGWIAISMTRLERGDTNPPYYGYAWLHSCKPAARVGRSILLYHVDPGGCPTANTWVPDLIRERPGTH